MTLADAKTRKLTDIIRNSFRVRKNQEPLYVDLGNNLARISAPQHLLIFGRRGSGKSCLMIHYLSKARASGVLPIYILADEYKKLTYPDILIRLLLTIVEALFPHDRLRNRLFRRGRLRASAKRLRQLLDLADVAEVVEDRRSDRKRGGSAEVGQGPAQVAAEMASSESVGRTSKFREEKIAALERYLSDYKKAIEEAIQRSRFERGCVLIDDFYLFPRQYQPDVIDYLHRLLRDTDIYLKIATIRHRTTPSRNYPQTVGVEPGEDVEELNLDRTLEDVASTQQYLGGMLEWMAIEAGLSDVTRTHFNADGLQALTLASGGVPRDFLNIFVHAVEAALDSRAERWLTPRFIFKGASRLTYQTKLRNLRDDADDVTEGLERLFVDIMRFCLDEKKKTAFLVAQEETQQFPREHDLIQQLMDMKLIHVVEPDTSAASGRTGRYEAYTLDFSLFMEPRRRGIEHVTFWERDKAHRKKGIREAPVYSLRRAGEVFDGGDRISPEEYLEAASAAADDEARSPQAVQGGLFDET